MIIWEHCCTVRTSADVRRRHNDDDGCTRCADNERKAGTGIQYDDGHGYMTRRVGISTFNIRLALF